jgi:prepilin-type N-terminal cleavage/methylation domain-containing protein
MRRAGFTLVEVLIAMAILSIAVTGIAPIFMTHLQINTTSGVRSGAVAAAQQKLDALRLVDPATMPLTGSSAPEDVTVGGRTYQVTTTYCAMGSFCNAESRYIQVEVSYREKTRYTVDTVFTQLR